ncbi:hypothetical protein FSP39_018752 [Pinctada imbricata]|uniref:G-protein coupled receptors family 1 profile domain-containing protein n=1 Tax=Pinctada imbricata TaxID=66713 RepID=A0AA88XTC6_PINIB|nr:hypothetical protein FSP39_018752 [Pinctada imbricata]
MEEVVNMNASQDFLEPMNFDSIFPQDDVMNGTTPLQIDDLVELVCYKYVGPTLCVIGVIGNFISLLVLSGDQLKESPYVYLRALATTDMLALLFSFPFMVFCIGTTNYFWRWYEIYVFIPLVNFFTASSVWITAAMTIERLLFVRHPLWARWRCNRNNAQFRIWIIVVFAVIISVPRFFCYEIKEEDKKAGILPTDFRYSTFYYVLDIFAIVTLHFIPLIVFSVINVYLVCELQHAKVLREELNLRSNRETEWQMDQRRFTVTLISIVLLSIMSILPAAIADIFLHAKFGYHLLRTLRNVSNLLLWCNLSMNFLLYCAFNKRFVRALTGMFDAGIFKVRNSLRKTKTDRTTVL